MEYTLILGGGGFIGSNLVQEFIKQDKKVIVFSKFNDYQNKKFSELTEKVVYITGSLSETTLIKEVFSKYKISEVIHLISSLIPSSNLEDFTNEYKEVIIPTIHLIDIMANFNVRKFVYLSSGGTVYGNYKVDGYYSEEDPLRPINYYGLSKYNIEEIIKLESRKNKIDYLILRPSNPFGKFQNIYGKQGLIAVILGKLINNQVVEIWGNGQSERDYVPIQYLCRCIIKLVESGINNQTFNIGSGYGHSINEIIEIIEKTLNVKVNKTYEKPRNVDSDKMVLNIDKMKKVIDIEEIDLSESILDFYKFLLEDYNGK